MHHNALTAMLQQQSSLSKIQNQIATGKRVQTPADDPAAAVHILELQRALQEAEQYGKNSDMATNRLTLEEQALADIGTLLHRARELAIQGNNATVDEESRRLLATEVRGRLQELLDIANRKDANGEYLFSGYSTLTEPFVRDGSSIEYQGDQGSRLLQVGPTQRVADSHTGHDVFLNVPEGNGTFVTGAAATNAGGGIIANGTVTDRAAWIPDDYRIQFTSASGDYRIVDSEDTVVATGIYTENSAISFRGVSINMTGMPAVGDEFSVFRSRTEDIFSTLDDLATALESPLGTQAERAQITSRLGSVLEQLERTQTHLLGVRAEVGTRLSALENAENARADQTLELERTKSELEDLDYADAITKMNLKLVGLQAAQASYVQISQLSLFNYLK